MTHYVEEEYFDVEEEDYDIKKEDEYNERVCFGRGRGRLSALVSLYM